MWSQDFGLRVQLVQIGQRRSSLVCRKICARGRGTNAVSDNSCSSSNPKCMCVCVSTHVCACFCSLVSLLSPRGESWSQHQASRIAGSVTDYLPLHRTLTAGKTGEGRFTVLEREASGWGWECDWRKKMRAARERKRGESWRSNASL